MQYSYLVCLGEVTRLKVSNVKRWDIFVEYFNDNFKLTGTLITDKQKLAGKYTALVKGAKKEPNKVRQKAMFEVAKIIKSMME